VAAVIVDLGSGRVTVERYWVVADVGVVVNPRLLRLNIEGGSAMGISQALMEELQFDRSRVTSTDYRSYPIMTMADMPEIEVELLDRRDLMSVGMGAEPPNMLPPVALAGAFFDATGKAVRKLPLKPGYVQAELRE
jgi:CO/xanthine dehydrogenase Mo-binding subunit